uniref:Cysteine-rich venom protein-like n=1 Tax=Myripristis murdjan TaxID=586833 RepID=A0A667X6V6_9TELE
MLEGIYTCIHLYPFLLFPLLLSQPFSEPFSVFFFYSESPNLLCDKNKILHLRTSINQCCCLFLTNMQAMQWVENYQYPNGSTNGKAIGHYTQVVWYSSYKVGCGAKLCPGNIYFYGCHYYRAGNFRTVAPYKAGPPCASCPNSCENKLCNNPCPYINRFRNCPALKKQHGCSNTLVYAWCPAECKCNNEIIAVG